MSKNKVFALKKFYASAILSSTFLSLILLFSIFPIVIAGVNAETNPLTGDTTISMTTPTLKLFLKADENDENGTFSASDPAGFSVSTNNLTGYTLSMSAVNDSTLGGDEFSFKSIKNATADGTGFGVGDWGIKPSKLNSETNNSFIPAPGKDGIILDDTSAASATNYTFTFGAKVDTSTPVGFYENEFVFSAVANPSSAPVIFDAGTDDDVDGLPTPRASEDPSRITLPDSVPTRDGYDFVGWCDGEPSGADCNGDLYNPGDTIDLTTKPSTGIKLKAVWEQSPDEQPPYTITFDANGGNGGAPDPITVNLGDTNLGNLNWPYRYSDKEYIYINYTYSDSAAGATGPTGPGSTYRNISYSFNGWYKEPSATHKIADNNYPAAFQPDTAYTNSSSEWTHKKSVTLYAGWTRNSGTPIGLYLAGIVRGNDDCYWTDGTTRYNSYTRIVPTEDMDLTGVCIPAVTFDDAFSSTDKTKVTVGDNSYYKAQDMDVATCNLVSVGETAEVVDIRDNEIYTIGKIKDGRCWFLDNLRLDLFEESTRNNMNSTNTNATDLSISYLFNGGGTDTNQYATNRFIPNVNVTSYQNARGRANKDYKNEVVVADEYGREDSLAADAIAGNWRVGMYYNFCAASAGSFCWGVDHDWGGTTPDGGQPEDTDPDSPIDAKEDICPTGWRLPTGGSGGEFHLMTKAISGANGDISATSQYNSVRRTMRLPLTENGRSYTNFEGSYWSSTTFGIGSMRDLNVSYLSGMSTQQTGTDRKYTIAIRCINKQD